MRYRMGDLVELVTETNSDLKYGLDDIVGVTLEKQMIPTIANLTQTDLDDFIIVHPRDFVYNPRTHGKKIGLGFNTTDRCFISTWNNNTFHVKPEMAEVIIPEYLYMHFLRERWDKEACFNAWGSSTVVLLWSSFCDMKIKVPPIEEQRKIVHDYQVITDRIELLKKMNSILLSLIQEERKYWLEDYGPFGGNRPNNWKEVKLTDVANIVTGYSYSSDELCESTDIRMATIKNFEIGGGFRISGYKGLSPKKTVKPEQYCELFDTIVAHTDLTQGKIIGSAESILSVGDASSVLISMDLVKVTPKVKGISKYLITAILQDNKFRNHCLQFINGTTVMHLSKDALKQYRVFLPNDYTCFEILNKALKKYYKMISINLNEIELLNKVKPFVMR